MWKNVKLSISQIIVIITMSDEVVNLHLVVWIFISIESFGLSLMEVLKRCIWSQMQTIFIIEFENIMLLLLLLTTIPFYIEYL